MMENATDPGNLATHESQAAEKNDFTSGLTFEVFNSFSALEGLRGAWDDLAVETQSPIYMSFDWARLWWEFYGDGKGLRIVVCHARDRLVAVIPLSVESLGVWPVSLRVARIVGANLPPRIFRLPVLADYRQAVFEKLLEHLFKAEQCHLLSLALMHENSAEGLTGVCSSCGSLVQTPVFLARDVSTTFHLQPTYEEYFESLDSKERKIRRKKLRDLESEREVRAEIVQDDKEVIAEFERFAEQHTRQWQAEGRPGHFAAWPRGIEFHRALVAAHAKHNRVRFVKLFADDTVVANQYTYAFGDTIYALLPARASEHAWERFSLGGTSQIKLIESSIEDGFKRLESGLGHYDYKVLLNGVESPVGIVRIVRKSFWARGMVKLYESVGRLLTLFLHKIWYRRIAPRLGRVVVGRPSILVRFEF